MMITLTIKIPFTDFIAKENLPTVIYGDSAPTS